MAMHIYLGVCVRVGAHGRLPVGGAQPLQVPARGGHHGGTRAPPPQTYTRTSMGAIHIHVCEYGIMVVRSRAAFIDMYMYICGYYTYTPAEDIMVVRSRHLLTRAGRGATP